MISQIPSGVRARVTPVISPLSGSTNHWPATETAISRRSVPTPGSTTARWTVPLGKTSTIPARTKPPSRMFCGEIVWVTSTNWVPGARSSSTPLSAAT